MRWLLVILLLALSPFQTFAGACDADLLRPEHEGALLSKSSSFLRRNGDILEIILENGKTKEFKQGANGKSPLRVSAVDPNGAWVALFTPKEGSIPRTRLVHRGSGRDEEFLGCPEWSPDGKSFVSLSEAGVNGAVANEARLWRCEDPAHSCMKIWSSKKAGHAATWTNERIEIVLRDAHASNVDGFQKVHCAPTAKGAYCQTKLPDLPKKKRAKKRA